MTELAASKGLQKILNFDDRRSYPCSLGAFSSYSQSHSIGYGAFQTYTEILMLGAQLESLGVQLELYRAYSDTLDDMQSNRAFRLAAEDSDSNPVGEV